MAGLNSVAHMAQLAFDWLSGDLAFDSDKKSLIAPADIKKYAIDNVVNELPPSPFQHPRANREIRLGAAHVAYLLRRATRRSIGFVVGPDGLVVSAPKWVPLYEVDAAVREKARWIVEKLSQSRDRQQRQMVGPIDWKDGATLPYLGDTLTLVLDPTHGFGKGGAALKPSHLGHASLYLGLPSAATHAQIRDAVQAWLTRQARALFTERLNHFAPTLGVQWHKLSLSSAKTRWGSASSSGAIRLNWRLIHFRPSVIDYVVVHELSHLREMNHSPRFWGTVEGVMPDYAALRKELKQVTVPGW